MAFAQMGKTRLRVAVTGASSELGERLLARLIDDPSIEAITCLDVTMANVTAPQVSFRRVDLTNPSSEAALLEALASAKVDALYHLAFVSSRVHRAAFAHELEVLGTLRLLAAAGQLRVSRVVVPSLTALYGATGKGAAYAQTSAALHGAAGSRYVGDRIEVERQLQDFARHQAKADVVVLRLAPVVGPRSDNPVTRLLKTRLVPTVLGFDPLWQVVHEDDAATALHRALTCAPGTYNVAARGVLPFSSIVAMSGGNALPLPSFLLRSVIALLEAVGRSSVPVSLLDYLRYSCLADVGAAEEALDFLPRYSIAEAVQSMCGDTAARSS